jgi:geranylgeranyl diphosphate synthase type II
MDRRAARAQDEALDPGTAAAPFQAAAARAELDAWLRASLPAAAEPHALHAAMGYALLSPGKRLRPALFLAALDGALLGKAELRLARACACALEMVHAASLVHDDLPCFDDAGSRRGRPTTHRLFGEALALLAGDALLARALALPAQQAYAGDDRPLRLVHLLGQAVGSERGIIGGQSLEIGAPRVTCPDALAAYHRGKTGALFAFALEAARILRRAPESWWDLGSRIGEAFQILDDLGDVDSSALPDKDRGRDAALARPSAVATHGLEGARVLFETHLDMTVDLAQRLGALTPPLRELLASLRLRGST